MTVWNKAISWSKVKAGLECGLQLQYSVDKKIQYSTGVTYYLVSGRLSQRCFELYFNQGINLNPKARTEGTMIRVVDKVFAAELAKHTDLTYLAGKTEQDLKQLVLDDVLGGFRIFQEMGLLDRRITSEVKRVAYFRGLRFFALIDFLVELDDKTVQILDGKGHVREDADPRQLQHYALTVAASGQRVADTGGLLYWKHGYRPVDTSPAAIKNYVEEEFGKVRPLFEKLKIGTGETFPADPSPTKCNKCAWKLNCPASVYRRAEVLDAKDTAVGFAAQPQVPTPDPSST